MKNSAKKKKTRYIFTFSFITLLLFLGIIVAKAYYNNTSEPMRILASVVGDFNSGDGDANMIFFKKNSAGDYVRTYAVPAIGYVFDDTKTNCSITCANNDSSAACYYVYNANTKSFTLNSEDKVTCKFYFNREADEDIIINVYKQVNNSYELSEVIPAYGYAYSTYSCTNGSTLTYSSSTRTFSAETTQKDTCNVYFDIDNTTSSDVTTIVYVQKSVGSSTYEMVETIPQNKTYVKSTTQTSKCVDANSVDTNATITYSDGSINISASGQQTCTVYLDLES